MFCISSLLIKKPEQGFIDENMNCRTGHRMEGSVQHKDRIWNKRRYAKQIKLDLARKFADGVVIPTQNIVQALETLITPGDRVVLEGNNQKQAE